MSASYFDAHCDTLTALDGRYSRIRLDLENENFERRGQIFAVCADNRPRPFGNLLESCVKSLQNFKSVKLCKSSADLINAENEKKTAAFLSIEGGEVIDCDEERLKQAFDLGVRLIGPTWNIANGLSGTCVKNKNRGLTKKGKSFVIKAIQTGMVLDISHISDPAAKEIIELAGARAFASHSNSRKVCDNRRNITDELFISLSENGGVCGINLYPPHLSKAKKAGIKDVLLHIEHFASLFPGAAGHIALGCDLDGCENLTKEIETSRDIGKIYEALLKENYSEQIVRGIFYENLRSFLLKAF